LLFPAGAVAIQSIHIYQPMMTELDDIPSFHQFPVITLVFLFLAIFIYDEQL
jgi:hypothetical protein